MKSTEVDLSRHYSLQIKTFKYFGMWFYISHSVKSIRFWAAILIRIVLGIIIFLIPVVAELLYVVKLLIQGTAQIQEVAGIINLVLTELLASIRLLDLLLRRNILTELRVQLMNKEFKFNLKPQKVILKNAVVFSRKLFWVHILTCALDILIHVIVVPGIQQFKVLPLKMDLIWIDIYSETYFAYVFAYQVLYKPMVLAIFVALQTLPWASMNFAISQLDVLIYNFEHMTELVKATMSEKQCDENAAFEEIFKSCFRHHSAIIRFVNTAQSAFGVQMSSTLCLCGVIVCTTAVQIFSIESPLKNISSVIWILAFFAIMTCIMFVDCYLGNVVTVKSLHVSTVVYACPWITLPTSQKKNLLLFIAKTQQPLVIFAAKIVPVSLETFTKVMNWTYKGFAIMNQMKK